MLNFDLATKKTDYFDQNFSLIEDALLNNDAFSRLIPRDLGERDKKFVGILINALTCGKFGDLLQIVNDRAHEIFD